MSERRVFWLTVLISSFFSSAWWRIIGKIVHVVGVAGGEVLGYRPTFHVVVDRVDKIAVIHWTVWLILAIFIAWIFRWCLERWQRPREFGRKMWRSHIVPFFRAPFLVPIVLWVFGLGLDLLQWLVGLLVGALFGVRLGDWRVAVPVLDRMVFHWFRDAWDLIWTWVGTLWS